MGKFIRFSGTAQGTIPTSLAGQLGMCNQTLASVCVAIFIAIIILYASVDPSALAGKHYILAAVVLIPLVFGVLYSTKLYPFGAAGPGAAVFWGAIGFLALYLVMRSYAKVFAGSPTFVMSVFFNLLAAGIIIAALATVYSTFITTLQSLQSLPKIGIIFQIILFLPCLFYAFIDYIRNEYNITTRPTVILLAVDTFLILVYFLTPIVLRATVIHSVGTPLISGVVYLDKHTDILTSAESLEVDAATAFRSINATPPTNGALSIKKMAALDVLNDNVAIRDEYNRYVAYNDAVKLVETDRTVFYDYYQNIKKKSITEVDSLYDMRLTTPDCTIGDNVESDIACNIYSHKQTLDNIDTTKFNATKFTASSFSLTQLNATIAENIVTVENTSNGTFRRNYAISFWVFINPGERQERDDIPIFRYGDKNNEFNAFPGLYYDAAKTTYAIEVAPSTETITLTSDIILPQTWNYMVFNYVGNGVEIFVNGELHRAVDFDSGLYTAPVYDTTDTITAGMEGGLYGALYEVKYHTESMTRSDITAFYAYRRLFALPNIPA